MGEGEQGRDERRSGDTAVQGHQPVPAEPAPGAGAETGDAVQRVTHNDRLLAIIVPREFGEPGVNFITADDATLQLGLLNHPKSKTIRPHAHKVRPREVTVTQEVLVLRKGKLRVDFYDDDETYLESRILEQGDTILLVSGGHGFEILEDADIIEVKTGPYLGEDEKKRFGPARPARLKITG